MRSRTRISLLAVLVTGTSVLGGAPAQAVAPVPLPLMEAGPSGTPERLSPVLRTAAGLVYYRENSGPQVWVDPTDGEPALETRLRNPAVSGDLLSAFDSGTRTFTWRTVGDPALQTAAVPMNQNFLASTPTGYVAERRDPLPWPPPDPAPAAEIVSVDVLLGGAPVVMGTLPASPYPVYPASVVTGPSGALLQTFSAGTSSWRYLPYDGSGAGVPFEVTAAGSCRPEDAALWCSTHPTDPAVAPTLTRLPLDGSAPTTLTGFATGSVLSTGNGVVFTAGLPGQEAVMTWDGAASTPATLLAASWGASSIAPSRDGSGTVLVTRTGALGTAGIWSVPLSGAAPTRLMASPPQPRKARMVAIAPGRVAWTDNDTPDDSLWVRDISSGSGGTSTDGAARLVASNASGVGLSLSGDRLTYSDNTFPNPGRLVDGGTTQQLNASAGSTTLSGDRVLLQGEQTDGAPVAWSLRDLRTGVTSPLPDAQDYDLWGERLVRLADDGAVWLSDLRTGADPVQLRAATPGQYMYGTVSVAGDVVAWNVSWSDGGFGPGSYRSDRKIQNLTDLDESPTDVPGLGIVEDLSTGYAVGVDCTGGQCSPTAVPLAGGETQQFATDSSSVAVDGNRLAFVSEDGLPSVVTLPEYADAPRLLAAPTAATALSPGSAWTARVVASRVLTACEVAIRNAANTVVRTLGCVGPRGTSTVTWDGRDDDGRTLPPGSYSWQLSGAAGDDALVDYDGGAAALSGTLAVAGTDVTAPRLTARSHAPDATAVAVGSSVTVTFSEPVRGVNGSTFLLRTAAGTTVPAAVRYDAATRVATLDPTASLAPDNRYAVSVAPGIGDLAGNALPPVSWSFTTGPAPAVTATGPAANARSAAVTGSVTAKLSEPVTGVSGSTFVLRDRNGKPVKAAVTYNVTTRVATLNPVAILAANSTYTASLTPGIRDRAGNPVVARSWAFTTGTTPTVTARTPAVDATGVARGVNVTATFSEAVVGASTRTVVLRSPSGATVRATVTYSAARRTVTVDPGATLAARTKYTVTLTGGASSLRDGVGDPLATTKWSFTTGSR